MNLSHLMYCVYVVCDIFAEWSKLFEFRLLQVIEEIYDSRFLMDTQDLDSWMGLKKRAGRSQISEDTTRLFDDWLDQRAMNKLPDFLPLYFANLYGLKTLVDRAIWELVCNAEVAADACLHSSVCSSSNLEDVQDANTGIGP